MLENLKDGSMKKYKTNSAQNIVYIDHSTSGTSASISQSSADPISLANIMRESVIVLTPPRTDPIEEKEKTEEEQKKSG